MRDDRIQIKGNKEGINAIIDMEKFTTFDEVIDALVGTLFPKKAFYKNSILKLTSNFKNITDNEIIKLKEELFDKINIKDCIFEEIKSIKQDEIKTFNGVNEGKTKFIKKTVRGGQIINYPGNVVIIGDINSGAEVYSGGNIIVLGSIKGHVRAGMGGNIKSVIAAFSLQPELLQIADIITIAPEDGSKPSYPEVAKIKDGSIVVEPYLPNKYIY